MNKANKPVKRAIKWVLILILSALLLSVLSTGSFLLSWMGYFPMGAQKKKQAFAKFFTVVPTSVEIITSGYDRDLSGHGSYVLIFRMPESELRELLEKQGFVPVGIETDPAHWRLDLCNSVSKRLVKTDIQINPSFDCFSKNNSTNSARVFYDKSQNVAILVAFGKYTK